MLMLNQVKKIILSQYGKRNPTQNPTKEYASCGIYYFKSLKIFKFFAKRLLKKTKREYVSLIFNLMKKSNLKLNIFEVEKFICLGTPLDLESIYTGKDTLNKISSFQINLFFLEQI